MEQNEKLRLENQLCFPLYVCSKEIVRRYTPFLEPIGLTYTQYLAMLALWEREVMTVKELGQMIYLDSGTLTPMLKKLEVKGYLKRMRSASDERSVVLTLTDEGRELKKQAADIPDKASLCMKIDPQDEKILHEILNRIISGFGEEEPQS
ncbi:MAG: MarR family transcriptional regulator [Clostridia bacterium]|nr:MarR family transcriptional regulator [Clostridia bacterium]